MLTLFHLCYINDIIKQFNDKEQQPVPASTRALQRVVYDVYLPLDSTVTCVNIFKLFA